MKDPLQERRSRSTYVNDAPPFEDPITTAIESSAPISLMENPDEIVPHDLIPNNLSQAIISTYGKKFFLSHQWTRERLRRLHKAIIQPKENLTNTIAQICSANCSSKDLCPYDIVGEAPVGERCPIELTIAKLSYEEYVNAVALRLSIDPEDVKKDIILHNLISGLVESDMIEARLNSIIANEGFITEVPVIIHQETGVVYKRDDETVAIRIKERVARRKDQLYKQLLATPEMAEKYRRSGSESSTRRTVEALDKLIKLVEKKEAAKTLRNNNSNSKQKITQSISDTAGMGETTNQ